jgi:hypothetical protein
VAGSIVRSALVSPSKYFDAATRDEIFAMVINVINPP